jgi:hypothetical protein
VSSKKSIILTLFVLDCVAALFFLIDFLRMVLDRAYAYKGSSPYGYYLIGTANDVRSVAMFVDAVLIAVCVLFGVISILYLRKNKKNEAKNSTSENQKNPPEDM